MFLPILVVQQYEASVKLMSCLCSPSGLTESTKWSVQKSSWRSMKNVNAGVKYAQKTVILWLSIIILPLAAASVLTSLPAQNALLLVVFGILKPVSVNVLHILGSSAQQATFLIMSTAAPV